MQAKPPPSSTNQKCIRRPRNYLFWQFASIQGIQPSDTAGIRAAIIVPASQGAESD